MTRVGKFNILIAGIATFIVVVWFAWPSSEGKMEAKETEKGPDSASDHKVIEKILVNIEKKKETKKGEKVETVGKLRAENHKLTLSRQSTVPEYVTSYSDESNNSILEKFESEPFDFFESLEEIPIRTDLPVVGIQNIGNSCYASSVLQSLYRLPIVRKIIANFRVYSALTRRKVVQLQTEIEEIQKKSEDGFDLLAIFQSFDSVEEYKADAARKTEIEQNNLEEGLKLVEGMNAIFNQLQFNKHSAPCEYYFPHITDARLYEKAVTSNPYSHFKAMQCLPDFYGNLETQDASEYLEYALSRLTVILSDCQKCAFGIVTISEAQNSQGVSLRPASKSMRYVLSLKFPDIPYDATSDAFDLNDMIKHTLCKKEIDEGNFETQKITSLPQILPIDIKRAEGSFSKIVIPDDLDLSEYVCEDLAQSAHYKLIKMVIVHENQTGPLAGPPNHYTVYVLESDANWYKYDDDKVAKISEDDANDKLKDGFLYFYERQSALK